MKHWLIFGHVKCQEEVCSRTYWQVYDGNSPLDSVSEYIKECKDTITWIDIYNAIEVSGAELSRWYKNQKIIAVNKSTEEEQIGKDPAKWYVSKHHVSSILPNILNDMRKVVKKTIRAHKNELPFIGEQIKNYKKFLVEVTERLNELDADEYFDKYIKME